MKKKIQKGGMKDDLFRTKSETHKSERNIK